MQWGTDWVQGKASRRMMRSCEKLTYVVAWSGRAVRKFGYIFEAKGRSDDSTSVVICHGGYEF